MRGTVGALMVIGALAGCGSSGGGTGASPSATAVTATVAPSASATASATASPTVSPTTTATPAPSGPYILTVASAGIRLTMTPIDCLGAGSAAPVGSAVLYADCSSFTFILAAKGGPLDGLAGSTATMTWINAAGATVTGTLDGTKGTLPRSDTGAYSGHGAIPKAFFVQLRGVTEATELPGVTT